MGCGSWGRGMVLFIKQRRFIEAGRKLSPARRVRCGTRTRTPLRTAAYAGGEGEGEGEEEKASRMELGRFCLRFAAGVVTRLFYQLSRFSSGSAGGDVY